MANGHTVQAFSSTSIENTFLSMMKRLQPQKDIKRLWEQQYPFLSMVKKIDDFEGTQIEVPWEYDHPMVSRTFSNAQDSRYGSSSLKPALTRTKMYGVGRVDMETARAARSNRGSWVRTLAREQKNVLMAMRKRCAIQLWRNHGGALGQLAASGAIANGDGTNDRLLLASKQDVYNFHRGMVIQADTVDGTSGALHSGTLVVRKLDFTNGYLYVAQDHDTIDTAYTATSGISSLAASDYLFAQGDWQASFRGVDSWIPLTAPSAGESFLGIDRSVSPERLAGHRLNDTSLSREEIVQELAARLEYTGGGDVVCFMAPIQVKQFALELDSKVVRDPGGKGRVGFRGIVVDTALGAIEVLSDPSLREDRCYLLDMDSWEFHHLDPFPHLVEDEGLTSLRVSNADQVEFRYRLWGNLMCTMPGGNAVAALPLAF